TALGSWPTTTIGSRRPSACTRSTAKPFSGLWKITASMEPDRVSDMSLLQGLLGPRKQAYVAEAYISLLQDESQLHEAPFIDITHRRSPDLRTCLSRKR